MNKSKFFFFCKGTFFTLLSVKTIFHYMKVYMYLFIDNVLKFTAVISGLLSVSVVKGFFSLQNLELKLSMFYVWLHFHNRKKYFFHLLTMLSKESKWSDGCQLSKIKLMENEPLFQAHVIIKLHFQTDWIVTKCWCIKSNWLLFIKQYVWVYSCSFVIMCCL